VCGSGGEAAGEEHPALGRGLTSLLGIERSLRAPEEGSLARSLFPGLLQLEAVKALGIQTWG
jgi:hypothetical protein